MQVFAAPALAGVFMLALLSPDAVLGQDSRALKGDEVRALYSGNEMTGANGRGQKFKENYRADGTFRAESTKTNGDCCISDGGRWWIEGDKVCKQYDNWRGGKKSCNTIVRRPDGYATAGGFKLNFKRQ